MAESGGPADSGDSPEYLTVLKHIADINQRIPPAERSTVTDKLLQAGLITAASHTDATALGTAIPHSQLISSLMSEAMAKIKTCSRLFDSLINILRTIDDTFATELTTECCECPSLSYTVLLTECSNFGRRKLWRIVKHLPQKIAKTCNSLAVIYMSQSQYTCIEEAFFISHIL